MITKIHNIKKSNARTISEPVPNGVDVLQELIAEEGMKLTQNAYIDIKERIIASAVMLGRGCSPDDWMEISQEDADKIIKEQEQSMENK